MPRCPVPVFVLGCGRSGTTVTARLLNHLPGVHIAKETGYLNQHLDLLKQIHEVSVPTELLQVVNSWLQTNDWSGRVSAEGFAEFCRRQGMSGAAAFIHYVWSLDCPEPWEQLQFIGDNTPLYVLSIPELKQLLPEARFIHIVRDPRDVVCSTLKMRFGAFDATVAAMEWHITIGAWLMAERWLPAQDRIEFRYEDLCISPENTFARVAGFPRKPAGPCRNTLPADAKARPASKLSPHNHTTLASLNHSAPAASDATNRNCLPINSRRWKNRPAEACWPAATSRNRCGCTHWLARTVRCC
jgi:hypothetical protein